MAPFLFSDIFESYLLVEKRYSEHTLLAYLKDVEQFFDFTPIASPDELEELNHKIIRGWIVSLVNQGLKNKSVNRKLSSLRTYFLFLKKQGLIKQNPVAKVVGPKSEKRLPQFAEEKDMMKRFRENDSMDFESVRDQLMIELFYQTGIRLSELINLKLTDVQADKIKVLGKRNKERIIPISTQLGILLNQYLLIRNKTEAKSVYLILTNKGNKVYPKFVYRKINIYLGSVTDLQKCSPHVLRHTFATHMLNNGAGLESIKELLGHASLSATQVYTHNSFAQLNNIYSQAHPRGHKTK